MSCELVNRQTIKHISFFHFYLIYIYLFKQVLLKMMEHYYFLFCFFKTLLFFLCWDLHGKGIVPYLFPKHFRPYCWSSLGVV